MGTGDATQILDIFVSGVDMDASIGYAIADDIILSVHQNEGSPFGGSLADMENFNMSIGGQYFLGDYFVGARIIDPLDEIDFGLTAGRYIPVRETFYLSPQVNLMNLADSEGRDVSLTIGFGARF